MKIEIITLIIILISFLIGIYFYPQMPEEIASHWNAQGQVNGYMPKLWGLFFMPVISLIMLAFFILIPKIDPLKENIKKFRKYFDIFVIIIILFLFYIYLLTILWNLGIRFEITQLIIPPIGILFFYAGVLTENSKRNWFIGIRTPWTISNEKVWNETNRLGGKLFKISGLIALLGILFQDYAILLVIIPIVLASVYTFIFSYYEYNRLERRK
jgi:uncharacterized membrane protein